MLAIGLSAMLLSIVYAAVELHWRMEIHTRVATQRSLAACAVLRQIETDLRLVEAPTDDKVVFHGDARGFSCVSRSAAASQRRGAAARIELQPHVVSYRFKAAGINSPARRLLRELRLPAPTRVTGAVGFTAAVAETEPHREYLPAEITTIRVQYFHAGVWRNNWQGRPLPDAVKISLISGGVSRFAPPQSYEKVIHFPLQGEVE